MGLCDQMVTCAIRRLFYMLLAEAVMNPLGKGNKMNFDKMQAK